MLCAKFSPKLDAVETDEVGLSIASPDKQSGCAGKKAKSKITDDTNVHVRELDSVFFEFFKFTSSASISRKNSSAFLHRVDRHRCGPFPPHTFLYNGHASHSDGFAPLFIPLGCGVHKLSAFFLKPAISSICSDDLKLCSNRAPRHRRAQKSPASQNCFRVRDERRTGRFTLLAP